MISPKIHKEVSLLQGKVTSHQWGVVAEDLLPRSIRLSNGDLHLTARLYFHYINHIFSGLLQTVYHPSEAIIRVRGLGTILLWFSGIWCSTGEPRARITLEIRSGKLVDSDHLSEGTLEMEYLRDELNERQMLEFHIRLRDYYPPILGGNKPSQIKNGLYKFSQGYLHKKITTGFISQLFKTLQAESPDLKRAFGLDRNRLALMHQLNQIPDDQSILNNII